MVKSGSPPIGSPIKFITRTEKQKGKVFLVGAGPGDVGLLTIRARECIAQADVIIYDALVNPLVLGWARDEAEIINMGKRGGGKHIPQETITTVLIEYALQGKLVVRLKGGDPFIFGRGGEEAQRLAEEGIPFEVIPGVTSAVGVSAYGGIPLTHRDLVSQVSLLTGHPGSRIRWERVGPEEGRTLVVYMGLANLPYIAEKLVSGGWSATTPVALISRGTFGDQEVLVASLSQVAMEAKNKKMKTPVLAIIGKVVELREKIKWFESKPLFGLRILVAGSKDQAFELAKALEELGAVSLILPIIRVAPPDSWKELDFALAHLLDYHYIIFPSINSVKYFFFRFAEKDKDIRQLRDISLGAIGENTIAELNKRLLRVNLTSPPGGVEDFLGRLKGKGIRGKKVLIPTDINESSGQVAEFFQQMGNEVVTVGAYKITDTQIPASELRKTLVSSGVDLIIFTSPIAARKFCYLTQGELWEKIVQKFKVATVGALTAREVKSWGLNPEIISPDNTRDALIAEIVKKLGKERAFFFSDNQPSHQVIFT